MTFDDAFDKLIGLEGGYSNHKDDPGRETMWGVTARVARADGYVGEMRDLPKERAKSIYRRSYWDSVMADELPEVIRYSVFDAAVNSGPRQAIEWLQDAVDVGADGVIGPITLNAAKAENPYKVLCRMNAERLDFMTSLPIWHTFSRGWARRIAENLNA